MRLFLKLSIFLVLVGAVFMTVTPIFADSYGLDSAASTAGLKGKGVAGGQTVEEVVGNVVAVALSMIGIVFFLLIVYAGFTWMVASGNTEAVEKAKSIIEGAVIGLIIVMAAYAITRFVFDALDKGAAATNGSTSGAVTCPSVAGYSPADQSGLTTDCDGKAVGTLCTDGVKKCTDNPATASVQEYCSCQ